jgi:enoyl-CoA hydratase
MAGHRALPEADHRRGQWLCARRRLRVCLTGQSFSGREAFELGLASKVVPDAEVLDAALEIARTIAKMPPLAIRQIKEVMLAGADAPLETALMLERKAFQMLFDSVDQKEGMRAFLEKRKPTYRGS